MVIIISSPNDGHLPFVTKHLKRDFLVIDAGDIVEGRGLSYKVGAGGVRITHAGRILSDVTGVWVRRPRRLKYMTLPVQSEYIDYCKSALATHMEQLYALLGEARWISDIYAIMRAENKAYQLTCALRIGFTVPDTLITSSDADARTFVSQRGVTVVKTPARSRPYDQGGQRYLEFYARKITPQDVIRYDGLHVAPSIFQDLIDPGCELRVTVVGEQVFAAKVHVEGASDNQIRDWHIGYKEGVVRLEAATLSDDITRKCVRLVQALGLQYGAIDLIQDKEGKYWFIEINPNGQWAFVEDEVGLPIGQAVAALLEGRTPL